MRNISSSVSSISSYSNIRKYFTYTLKFHFSTFPENLLSHHPSHGQNIKHQRVIQLLHEPHGVQSLDATNVLHALTITMGPDPTQPFLANNTIMSKYSTFGEIGIARHMFDNMSKRNVASYNTMISAYSHNGSLLEAWKLIQGIQLQALAEKLGLFYIDAVTGTALLGLLGRKGCLDEYERVEEFMVVLRKLVRSEMAPFESTFMGILAVSVITWIISVSVSNSLINMYAKCSDIQMAAKMFEDVPVKVVLPWNTMVGAMAKIDRADKTLVVFRKCVQQLQLFGESIHAKVIQRRFDCDVYVGSALLDCYAKCDKLDDAHACFDQISEKTVVSWNTLMLGYSSKASSYAILLRQIIHSGCNPTVFSFSIAVKSSGLLEVLQLHSMSIKMGNLDNDYVVSSLISSYAKTSSVDNALKFVTTNDRPLPVNPDTESWNILIAACSRNGDYVEVFELLGHMQILGLFSVCIKLCNLGLGSSHHGPIVKTDFKRCDTFVCHFMIDMYGKCGSLASSIKIFNEMTNRNVISWTAIVSALGLHGYAYEALEEFKEMDTIGIKPDMGMELFGQMKGESGVEPEMDHYLIAVDLLARYAYLREAEQLITGMPFPPNALIFWKAA
ncbi:unnamed protein product [Withania somnifera]